MNLPEMVKLTESLEEYAVTRVYCLATYSTRNTMNKISLNREADILDNIIQAFDCSVRYASSYAVYDDNKYQKGDIQINYIRAKRDAEAKVTFYAGLDFDVVGYRIPAVYGGENNVRAMYKIVKKLKENEEIVLDKDVIEFCYISDVVDSLLSTKGCWDGIVEVPSEKVNLKTIVLRLKAELQSTSNIIDNNKPTQSEVDFIEHLLS